MRSTALLVLCPALALAQVTVSVDTGADVHPIPPLIYGINFATDADVVAGRLTLTRWGGNGTTRYNWQIDTTNTGADYFFENIPGCWSVAGNYCSPVPSDPRSNSGANALLGAAKTRGIATLFTVPVMGWVAATARYAHPFDCGCPRSLVAAQDAFDPYDLGCGNGLSGGAHVQCATAPRSAPPSGRRVRGAGPRRWSLASAPRTGRASTSSTTSPRSGAAPTTTPTPRPRPTPSCGPSRATRPWRSSRPTRRHRSAGPPSGAGRTTSALPRTRRPAGAPRPRRIARPTAAPSSSAWYLQQAKAQETASGKRVLHWLDLHYYPQGGVGPGQPALALGPDLRRSVVDRRGRHRRRNRPAVAADADWVAQNYPGTRLSLSEYAWFSDVNGPMGPVVYAELLGLFGRERLDAATAWGGPGGSDTAFAAFELFRNYDGAGSAFGDTSVRATIGSGTGAAAFAATAPGKVTIVLTNEQSSSQTVTVAARRGDAIRRRPVVEDQLQRGHHPPGGRRLRRNERLALPARPEHRDARGPGRIRRGRERRWNRGTDDGSDAGAPPAPDAGTVGGDGGGSPGAQGPGLSDVQGSCSTAAGGPVGALSLLLATLAFTRRRS